MFLAKINRNTNGSLSRQPTRLTSESVRHEVCFEKGYYEKYRYINFVLFSKVVGTNRNFRQFKPIAVFDFRYILGHFLF